MLVEKTVIKMVGLDISIWNHDRFPDGILPWQAIKNSGVDFVIIRTGCGRTLAEENFAKEFLKQYLYK